MPEDIRQIAWNEYGETILHPLALLFTLSMLAWLLFAPRTRVLIPMIIVAAFVTSAQRLVLGAFDFTMIRLMMTGGILRMALRNETPYFEVTRMDRIVVAYVLLGSVAYVLLWQDSTALINRLGFAFDAFLAFFVIRVYARSQGQIIALIRAFALVFLVVAFFMFIEHQTRYNFFSIFGGVSPITGMREGRLRAQGAFSHAIMAGTFGATFAPLFWGLWWRGGQRDRNLALLGGVSAVAIAWFSSSSGPLLSLMASVFAVFMWRYRQHTRSLRWALVVMLIVLDLVMEARVWHLISRVDIVGGSTGWHRYALIDNTIRRFPEWALVGVRTTGHWGWGLNDVTNHFVLQAVRGGVLTLGAFVLLVVAGFRSVGSAIDNSSGDEAQQKMYWAWGCVLFSHSVSFFGVSYFGQMNYFWYLTLGVIACLPAISGMRRAQKPADALIGEST